MNNNITELVFILDKSGSMHGLEADTIGGFNSMIDKQKSEEGKAYVTTVLFSDTETTVHDRVGLEQVLPMTRKDYVTSGCTALLDAVGNTIRHIETIHKYIRSEDVPAHTMFVITTDGMENASHRFTAESLKRLIDQKKELGWEFIFLGANIDAIATAKSFGIHEDHAVNYCPDGVGTALNFDAINMAVSDVRCSRGVKPNWKAKVEADHKKRG